MFGVVQNVISARIAMRVKRVDRKNDCVASLDMVEIGVSLRTALGTGGTATATAVTAGKTEPYAMLKTVALGIIAPPRLSVA